MSCEKQALGDNIWIHGGVGKSEMAADPDADAPSLPVGGGGCPPPPVPFFSCFPPVFAFPLFCVAFPVLSHPFPPCPPPPPVFPPPSPPPHPPPPRPFTALVFPPPLPPPLLRALPPPPCPPVPPPRPWARNRVVFRAGLGQSSASASYGKVPLLFCRRCLCHAGGVGDHRAGPFDSWKISGRATTTPWPARSAGDGLGPGTWKSSEKRRRPGILPSAVDGKCSGAWAGGGQVDGFFFCLSGVFRLKWRRVKLEYARLDMVKDAEGKRPPPPPTASALIWRRAGSEAFGAKVEGISAELKGCSRRWPIEDYLYERRREHDRVFDYRYSVAHFVFRGLVGSRLLSE